MLNQQLPDICGKKSMRRRQKKEEEKNGEQNVKFCDILNDISAVNRGCKKN